MTAATLRIGAISLANPVALAPMAGVTDLPFRQLCRRLGAGYVVGEMLASDPSLRRSAKSRLRGVHLEEPTPRAIQIVGWDPATLADAARYNVDQGASIIDINMGCPAKKVCKRDAGSALLADESLVARILDAVVGAVDAPVTLKIRTGISPERRNARQIARIAENSGVAALAVHGRTRACKYRGNAEYETIREVVSEVRIPVFANGDITSVRQARQIADDTGAAGIMIGRAAHGRPWFPGQVATFLETGETICAPPLDQQRQLVVEHLEAIYRFYGSARGVRVARKHIKWYVSELRGATRFLACCNRLDTTLAQQRLVADFYHQLLDTQDVSTESVPIPNEFPVNPDTWQPSWQTTSNPVIPLRGVR